MEPVDVDRVDIPRGWYDLVVLGIGWEAIGAAWWSWSLGARTALVPGQSEIDSCWVSVPRPLCQWWTASLPGLGKEHVAGQTSRAISWRPPERPFVEGFPMGGRVATGPLPADKALGQLAAAGVSVFRGQSCFQAPDVLEVAGQPIPFRKVLLALGVQTEPIQLPGIDPAEVRSPLQVVEDLGLHPPLVRPTKPPDVSGPSTGAPKDASRPGPSDLGQWPAEGPSAKGAGVRVAVLGGGSEECFWAQWLASRGCQVHLIIPEAEILVDHEPEARALLQNQLIHEGIRIQQKCQCQGVHRAGQAKALLLSRGAEQEKLFVDYLVAVPKTRVDLSHLHLQAARVAWDDSGVRIGNRLRTSNRRILAAGSVCGQRFQCARLSWAMVQWAVESALGRGPVNRDWLLPLQCTPTDPPIVRLGWTPEEATRECWSVRTYRVQTPSVGVCESQPGLEGFLAIHVRVRSGRILGATLAGAWAYELADVLSFLMKRKVPLWKWCVPIPCVSAAMGCLEESARVYLQDYRPRWWDVLVENLQHFWKKWKKRCSADVKGS